VLRRTDIAPSALATLAVILAVVVIAIPTCTMVGCTMTGDAMFVPFGGGLSFSSSCGGAYSVNGAPLATVPTGAETSLLALVGLAVVGAVVRVPRVELRPLRIVRGGDPPPPEETEEVPLRI
jgi:hypothetical protein